MTRPYNYTLIGMAGVGKTTLGEELASALGYDFIDTDKLIEEAHGRPLQSILDDFRVTDHGLDKFISEERRVFRLAKQFKHTVIATGGSFCYSPELLTLNKGIVIHLEISWSQLKNRLVSFDNRGFVLRAPSLHEEYLYRMPIYNQHAHISVCCDHKSIPELVAELKALTFEKLSERHNIF